MSNCRSGCPTKDHINWGECARDSNVSIGNATIASALKKNGNELNAYREARKHGIQPRSTKMADIQKAVRLSDKVGRAVKA